MKKGFVIFVACLTSFLVMAQLSDAAPGPKIEGPWLWVIAPTLPTGGQVAAESGLDYLAEASGGAVTETRVALNGVNGGSAVGDQVWTVGNIMPTDGDNLNLLAVELGFGEGDINDHVAYGYIEFDSASAQSTTMHAGSDDAVKVWLNGDLVHDNPVNRGASDFQDNFPVELQQGLNRLLVAVYERGGGWSGFFGFEDDVVVGFLDPIAVEPAGKVAMTWGRLKNQR